MAVFWYDVIKHLFFKVGSASATKSAQKGIDVPGNARQNKKQKVSEWFVRGPNMAPLMANS